MEENGCITREDFKIYIQTLRNIPLQSTGTIEEFMAFVRSTPIAKITKTAIRGQFEHLGESVTYLNLPIKEFNARYKELKKSLA